MKKITFSVIIPVFNVEQYIVRCVESVEKQNYPDIEVILVDDGSTDSSPAICDELANQYPNIVVFHKKNGGLSDARNYGIRKASGDYVVLLDSDDYISETACQELYSAIALSDKEPEIIAVGIAKYSNGKTTVSNRSTHSTNAITGKEFLLNELKCNSYFVAAVASVYNRRFLLANNLFFAEGMLHEDEDFTPRVYLKADRVISTHIAFYNYIIRENSITTKKNKRRNAECIFEICRALNKVYDSVDNEKLKLLLKTHSAKICFKAIEDAQLYRKENRSLIDTAFLAENCIYKKERIRLLLLRINPWVLHWFTRMGSGNK